VLRGRPAWHAGLTGGDRLLAIDGMKVARGELDTALRAHAPGETVEVAVFRGPRLVTRPVTLGDPLPELTLTAVDDPDDAQRTAFRRWTGRDLGDV
jgi:predicted metalloprotease with PDZ domain